MSLNVLDLCEQACVGAMPTRFSYVGCEEGADSSTTLVHINIIPPEVTDDDLRSAEDLVTFKFHSYKIMSICRIYSKLVFVVWVRASAQMRTHAPTGTRYRDPDSNPRIEDFKRSHNTEDPASWPTSAAEENCRQVE